MKLQCIINFRKPVDQDSDILFHQHQGELLEKPLLAIQQFSNSAYSNHIGELVTGS